jgi:opacity protein-like surface antigen
LQHLIAIIDESWSGISGQSNNRYKRGRTMKTFLVILVPLLFLVTQPALAQNYYPRMEIFGGVSNLPASGDDFPRQNSIGFQTGISGNLKRWFGISGDFGGQYSHVSRPAVASTDHSQQIRNIRYDSSVYEYLFGSRFTKRTDLVNVFGHGLVGGATGRASCDVERTVTGVDPYTSCPTASTTEKKFALGGGGGVDFNISPRIAMRTQMDWIGSFVEILEDNFRLGVGIVIRVGGR